MAQRFLAQEALFEGVIKQNGTVSHDDHVVTRGYLHSNIVNAIHPDSANYASVVSDGGVNKLKIEPVTIVDTTVDSSNATIADFVSNVYTGANFQESDIVILTTASPSESWIHNGGTAGNANDWNLLNTQLSDAQVRALVSGGNALTYNSSTGVFDVVEADIQAMFSAGTGLAYSAGQYSLSASSDQISEGVSNLFFTTARMDAHLTAGAGLTFNAGQYSFTGSTDDVAEGSALYFTQARARGSIQASVLSGGDVQLLTVDQATGNLSVALSGVFAQLSAGTGLAYSNGVYSLDANTDNIQQLAGATNKFYADSLVDAHLSGGTAISYSAGVIAFNGSTSDVSEGSNLYHTTARARGSIQADPAAGNLVTFNQSSGDIALMLSSLRKGFANQSLTANTNLVLTHSLGERVVHVTAMDASGNDVQLEKSYTSSTQVTVKSTINLTGIDIAISI